MSNLLLFDHKLPWTDFTPGLTFGGGSTGMTFSTQTGRYKKIGKILMFEIQLTLSAKGSSTGTALVTGMPGSPAGASSFPVGQASGFSGLTGALCAIWLSGTSINLSQSAATGTSTISDTVFGNSSAIRLGGVCEIT